MGSKKVVKTSEIWRKQFSDYEREVLRRCLHLRNSECNDIERELKQRYWREMKERSRSGKSSMEPRRVNTVYRKFLQAMGYAERPFNKKHWLEFIKQGAAE